MVNYEKHQKIAFISRALAMMIAVACFLIPLCPAITMKSGDVEKTYGSCYSFIFFGWEKINSTNISYSSKGISGLALAGFIVIVVASLLLITSFFIHDRVVKKPIVIFCCAITFIVGAIIFESLHKSVSNMLANALINGHSDTVSTTGYST